MDLSNLGSNKTGDAEPAFPWCRQRNCRTGLTGWGLNPVAERRGSLHMIPNSEKIPPAAGYPSRIAPEEYAQLVAKFKYPSS